MLLTIYPAQTFPSCSTSLVSKKKRKPKASFELQNPPCYRGANSENKAFSLRKPENRMYATRDGDKHGHGPHGDNCCCPDLQARQLSGPVSCQSGRSRRAEHAVGSRCTHKHPKQRAGAWQSLVYNVGQRAQQSPCSWAASRASSLLRSLNNSQGWSYKRGCAGGGDGREEPELGAGGGRGTAIQLLCARDMEQGGPSNLLLHGWTAREHLSYLQTYSKTHPVQRLLLTLDFLASAEARPVLPTSNSLLLPARTFYMLALRGEGAEHQHHHTTAISRAFTGLGLGTFARNKPRSCISATSLKK